MVIIPTCLASVKCVEVCTQQYMSNHLPLEVGIEFVQLEKSFVLCHVSRSPGEEKLKHPELFSINRCDGKDVKTSNVSSGGK